MCKNLALSWKYGKVVVVMTIFCTKNLFTAWISLAEYNPKVTLGIKLSFYFFFSSGVLKNRWNWGQCKVLYSIYGLSCDKLNVIHIWVHTVFWLFWREVASCCPGTLFLLTEKRLRSGLGEEGGRVGGWWISTDLDTITVPSPLLPHHFWPCSRRAAGNRKAQLSGRRFGQSGIKCRALFSHSVPGVGTPGDPHCAFSHTSLGGAAGILSFRKEKWAERESEAAGEAQMEGEWWGERGEEMEKEWERLREGEGERGVK